MVCDALLCALKNHSTVPQRYLAYMFDTDPQEAVMRISSPVGQTTIGKLEMIWTPAGDEKMIINDPSELIGSCRASCEMSIRKGVQCNARVSCCFCGLLFEGQPWTYRVDIKRAWGLPFMCTTAYVQYEFYGDVYTTEQVEHRTHAPEFHYSAIHRIECVTQVCESFLKREFRHSPPTVCAARMLVF